MSTLTPIASRVKPASVVIRNGATERIFALHQLIGRGGFSSVWLAHEAANHAAPQVALKIYRPSRLQPTRDDAMRTHEGFVQWEIEGRIATLPSHPSRVRIHGVNEGHVFGKTAHAWGSRAITIMDWVPGPTLENALADYSEEGGERSALARFDLMRFCRSTLGSLGALHQEGLLYTDLKPANIKLRRPCQTSVLLDLGGTLDIKGEIGQLYLTDLYASPELLSCVESNLPYHQYVARARRLTPASDLYSFGRILEDLFEHAATYKIDLEIPPAVRRLTNQLVKKHPGKRPQSSREALKMLEVR